MRDFLSARAMPRRLAAAALLALSILPAYRLLDPALTGLAGAATADMSETSRSLMLSGSLLLLGAALLGVLLVPPGVVTRWGARAAELLLRPRAPVLATVLGLLTTAITAVFARVVLGGKPNLIDGMAQLLHARALAAGRLAIAAGDLAPFRAIQNGVFTPHGWVSQYPPGHVLLLAAGLRLGAVWLVGPLLAGATIFFLALSADRLLPGERASARLGVVLAAVSPFLIGLAGAYMNHVTVGACIALALYAALRARDGAAGWAALAGGALGFALLTRPLSALLAGLALALGAWLPAARRGGEPRAGGLLARLGWAVVGALPFVLALAAYNRFFFGAPLRFGYDVAWGPSAGLGFHLDPWGNRYGPLEALAFTSSDLIALSVGLLESPVPLVALVALFLLLAKRLSAGERLLALLALLPVAGNAIYWHHGLFMGPRMLNEAAGPWVLLVTVAAVELVRWTPEEVALGERRVSPRAGLTAFLLAGLALGLGYLAPTRLLSYGGGAGAVGRTPAPRVPGPAVVFTHDAWTSRVATRLAGAGMPLDSVETVVRQNATCEADAYARAYVPAGASTPGAPARALPRLDLSPRASGFPPKQAIASGDDFRSWPGGLLTPTCLDEIASDRGGIVDITPLLWQTDLPGEPARGALVVRDRGPRENAALLRELPGRTPYVYMRETPDGDPRLYPYESAMARLWAQPAASPVSRAPAGGSS